MVAIGIGLALFLLSGIFYCAGIIAGRLEEIRDILEDLKPDEEP